MDIKDLIVVYPRGMGYTSWYKCFKEMMDIFETRFIRRHPCFIDITDYFKDKPYISNFKINDFLNSHNKHTL